MPYCPRCGSEYRAGIEQCPDCKVGLVDKPPHDRALADEDVELAELFTAQNEVEAYAVKERLESAGIAAFLKSMENPYYDGLMVHMYGFWGKVYVKKDDLEKATRIVEEAMAQAKEQPEE
jgi:hypothetical protein